MAIFIVFSRLISLVIWPVYSCHTQDIVVNEDFITLLTIHIRLYRINFIRKTIVLYIRFLHVVVMSILITS